MKGGEGSWWLQEIPEYFHFARVHVGDPYRVLRNPPQCFSLAPEAERRFCEFCYGIYILHAIPGALSRSEFIVANIAFPFAFITNPCLLRTVTLWKWNLSTHSRIFVKSFLTRRHAAYKHPPQMKRINTKQLKKKKENWGSRFEYRFAFFPTIN